MINWSGIGNKSLLGKALRLPLKLIPRNLALPIRQGQARNMRWIVGTGTHGCWLGTYEREKQQALSRFVRPGMTVYDIGAQAGFYTLIFSRLVGSSGRVYAFEPHPGNVQSLLKHLRLNKITNVHVIQVAVTDSIGPRAFSTHRDRYQNSLVSPEQSQLIVMGTSLDCLIENKTIDHPDLMKIDVEGAESGVLSGCQKLLEQYRPIVFTAFHGSEQRRRCHQSLKKQRYTLYDLSGNSISEDDACDETYALAL